jgi:gluconokinase
MLEWVRRTLYSELPTRAGFERLLNEAERVESHGLLCLPYLTGERSPHWNALVRGAVFGLSEHHERAHVARAALEGVAFCIADVWQLLEPDEHPVKLTGGLTRAPFWGQLVADTLGVRVQVDSVTDASALGAAVLGWAAVKRIKLEDAPRPGAAHGEGQDAERRDTKGQGTFVPNETVHEQRRTQRAHFRALYGAVDSYSQYTLESR